VERKTRLLDTLKDVLDVVAWGTMISLGVLLALCVVIEFASRWVH
jgi:hypothetical protein